MYLASRDASASSDWRITSLYLLGWVGEVRYIAWKKFSVNAHR